MQWVPRERKTWKVQSSPALLEKTINIVPKLQVQVTFSVVFSHFTGIFCVYCTRQKESLRKSLLNCIFFPPQSYNSYPFSILTWIPRTNFSVSIFFFFYISFFKEVATTFSTGLLEPYLNVKAMLISRYKRWFPSNFFHLCCYPSYSHLFCTDEAVKNGNILRDAKFHMTFGSTLVLNTQACSFIRLLLLCMKVVTIKTQQITLETPSSPLQLLGEICHVELSFPRSPYYLLSHPSLLL